MPIRTKPEPKCPLCSEVMLLRRPKPNNDWEAFWGCSNYPICTGTRNIKANGLPEEDDEIFEDDLYLDD